jgi:hypothetical protein
VYVVSRFLSAAAFAKAVGRTVYVVSGFLDRRYFALPKGASRTVSRGSLAMMRTVRRHLFGIVCVWLVCQVGSVMAAPILLSGDDLCTCPTDVPGAACPMHHHQDTGECVVRSAAPVPAATLASLIGAVGVMPPVQTTSPAILPSRRLLPIAAAVIIRSERPHPPPPRR